MRNATTHGPDGRPRARGLGLPFDGTPGPCNAITDVAGVEVGYCTLIEGESEGEGAGASPVGRGPVRSGVTAIHPRGRARPFEAVWAGRFSMNGNGEMTGVHWIDEAGYFQGPVVITNTHAVGMAHHATIRWLTRHPDYDASGAPWLLPVVAETCDALLNDMNGLHIGEAHVREALESAAPGPLREGNVGGGTGMTCYDFKGGIGSASRRVAIGKEADGAAYTVGVLVQANFGARPDLMVRGVPVGRHLPKDEDEGGAGDGDGAAGQGSIIGVLATDAPLLPIQLQRLARRMALGVARTGSSAENGSGDIFLAFSTGNPVADEPGGDMGRIDHLRHHRLNPLFRAAVEATEEAILNALVAADTMTGRGGLTVPALDHAALVEIMARHGRMA